MTRNLEDNRVLEQRPRLKLACMKLQEMALELGEEAKLPTMIELRSQLGMSLRTINDAVRLLESQQILRSVNGVGIYVTSPNARRKTRKLGLLFHVYSLDDPYMTSLLEGIRTEAARHNFELILLHEQEETIGRGKLDALLMYCHITEAIAMNLPRRLPCVLLFQHSPEFTCVSFDDFEGAKTATRHLLELGHRRIAYLLDGDNESIARQRQAGFEAAHHEAGISVEKRQIKFYIKEHTQSYSEMGEVVMTSWLTEDWDEIGYTGILAQNDEVAIGVMKALVNARLRVPQDISVVGFDGTKISDLCTPYLTTIKVPLYEMGVRAVKVLLEQVNTSGLQQEKVILPVKLKMGESTITLNKRSRL